MGIEFGAGCNNRSTSKPAAQPGSLQSRHHAQGQHAHAGGFVGKTVGFTVSLSTAGIVVVVMVLDGASSGEVCAMGITNK
jgi:hypothetical protein